MNVNSETKFEFSEGFPLLFEDLKMDAHDFCHHPPRVLYVSVMHQDIDVATGWAIVGVDFNADENTAFVNVKCLDDIAEI